MHPDLRGVILGTLVLTGAITPYDADQLQERLRGQIMPEEWREFLGQIEQILGRRVGPRGL